MEAGQGRWRPPPARRIENLQRRHETSLVEPAVTRLGYRPQPRTLVLRWERETLACGPAPVRTTRGYLGRWLFDLDGCDCFVGLLVLSRGDHAERGVAALAVVERLDVLEHRGLELEPGRPSAAVDELLLERGEERLGDRVVVGVAAGAHRDRDPGLPRGASEREADVLAALV